MPEHNPDFIWGATLGAGLMVYGAMWLLGWFVRVITR